MRHAGTQPAAEEDEALVGSDAASKPRAQPFLPSHVGTELQPDDTAEAQDASVATPYLLDLHGLSQATAKIALLQVPSSPQSGSIPLLPLLATSTTC